VLAQLQGPAILGYDPSMVTAGATVTVQTGDGLSASTGATSATTTTLKHAKKDKATKKGSTSSVTTTTVYTPPGMRNSPDFTTPSQTDMPLQPWDPRACTPAEAASLNMTDASSS
jgi:hypothetical protein